MNWTVLIMILRLETTERLCQLKPQREKSERR